MTSTHQVKGEKLSDYAQVGSSITRGIKPWGRNFAEGDHYPTIRKKS